MQVFEYVDHTLLHDLENNPSGLPSRLARLYLWQIIEAVNHCHSRSIIHRDIKPENVLVSKNAVIKICDFGFARTLAAPGEAYTDYVATRWYRAPELLVGDVNYGKPVDIWAIGCLLAEMLTGDPLFPGDSDIDQLYHIVRTLGNLPQKHQSVFSTNRLFKGIEMPTVKWNAEAKGNALGKLLRTTLDDRAIELIQACLHLTDAKRDSCINLHKKDFFTYDRHDFAEEVKARVRKDKGSVRKPASKRERRAEKEKKSNTSKEKEAQPYQQAPTFANNPIPNAHKTHKAAATESLSNPNPFNTHAMNDALDQGTSDPHSRHDMNPTPDKSRTRHDKDAALQEDLAGANYGRPRDQEASDQPTERSSNTFSLPQLGGFGNSQAPSKHKSDSHNSSQGSFSNLVGNSNTNSSMIR